MFAGGMVLNILKSIILGIIQGITEFMPISNTGHMSIFGNVFKLDLYAGAYFKAMTYVGVLIALIVVFHEDIWHMIQEFFEMATTVFANLLVFIKRKKGDTRYTYFKIVNSNYKKLDVMIMVSLVPTAIIAILGRRFVALTSNIMWFVGLGFILNALLLFVAGKYADSRKRIKEATYSEAYFIGTVQGVALLPGLSRTGATICAARIFGFNRKLAVKYSFIMAIPAVLGAFILEIKALKGVAFGSSALPGYFLGMIAAGVSAYFTIKYMMKLISMRKYTGFSIYCLILGLVAIIFSIIR